MNSENNQFWVDKIGKQEAVSGYASDHDPNFMKNRDHLASAALQGAISAGWINSYDGSDIDRLSIFCYKIADSMMAARKTK